MSIGLATAWGVSVLPKADLIGIVTEGPAARQRHSIPGIPVAGLILSLIFFLMAALLPAAQFQAVSVNQKLPAPLFDGMLLLRVCLTTNGALIIGALALYSRSKFPVSSKSATPETVAHTAADDIARAQSAFWLCLLTTIGAVLRFWDLGDGLWLDEISPVVDYGKLSPLQVLSTYLGSNNHVMNTMLVNASTATFGLTECAIRLPAVVFGIAAIPAMYWMSRSACSRRASLGAAAILTFSYHHIFFSQNARGYTGYLFFSILTCGLLNTALRSNLRRWWTAYTVAAVADIFALLNGVFVIGAQGLVALVTVAPHIRASGENVLLKRFLTSFAMIGFLILQLYALILPQILGVMHTTYAMKSAGFASPFSAEFLADLAQGLAPNKIFAVIVGAGAFCFVAIIGFASLMRKNPILGSALLLPNLAFLAFVLVEHLAVTPRLFIFGMVIAIICLAMGLERLAIWAPARLSWLKANYVFSSAILAIVLANISALPTYYTYPKQDYPSAAAYLAKVARPGDRIVVLYLAKYGYSFYVNRTPSPPKAETVYIRDPKQFAEIVANRSNSRTWVVSTFERALRLDLPLIDVDLHKYWQLVARFRGKIADGNILVYAPAQRQLSRRERDGNNAGQVD